MAYVGHVALNSGAATPGWWLTYVAHVASVLAGVRGLGRVGRLEGERTVQATIVACVPRCLTDHCFVQVSRQSSYLILAVIGCQCRPNPRRAKVTWSPGRISAVLFLLPR